MALQLSAVTFDCSDVGAMAGFWSEALTLPVEPGANGWWATLGGTPPRYAFVKVPEPRTAKNRVHVDLASDDRPAEVARLVDLGASVVAEHDQWGTRRTVLADVEGNQFCVTQRA